MGSRPITAELDSTWQLGGGSFAVDVALDGIARHADFTGTIDTDQVDPQDAMLNMFSPLEAGGGLVLLLFMPEQLVRPGAHAFHSFETWGLLASSTDADPFNTLGLIGDGQLQLARAEAAPGAPFTGRFDAVLYQTACLDPGSPAAL